MWMFGKCVLFGLIIGESLGKLSRREEEDDQRSLQESVMIRSNGELDEERESGGKWNRTLHRECVETAVVKEDRCGPFCGGKGRVVHVTEKLQKQCEAIDDDFKEDFKLPCQQCPDSLYKKVPINLTRGVLRSITYTTVPNAVELFPEQPASERYDPRLPCEFIIQSKGQAKKLRGLPYLKLERVESGVKLPVDPDERIDVYPGDILIFSECDIATNDEATYKTVVRQQLAKGTNDLVFDNTGLKFDIQMEILDLHDAELEAVTPDCTLSTPAEVRTPADLVRPIFPTEFGDIMHVEDAEDLQIGIARFDNLEEDIIFGIDMDDGGAPVEKCKVECREITGSMKAGAGQYTPKTGITVSCLGKTEVRMPGSEFKQDAAYLCQCSAVNSAGKENGYGYIATTTAPGCGKGHACCRLEADDPASDARPICVADPGLSLVQKATFAMRSSDTRVCKTVLGDKYKKDNRPGACLHNSNEIVYRVHEAVEDLNSARLY